jgi:hypothetical protein
LAENALHELNEKRRKNSYAPGYQATDQPAPLSPFQLSHHAALEGSININFQFSHWQLLPLFCSGHFLLVPVAFPATGISVGTTVLNGVTTIPMAATAG